MDKLLVADLPNLQLPTHESWPWMAVATATAVFGIVAWFSSWASKGSSEPFLKPDGWLKVPIVDKAPAGRTWMKYR